jgi:hypothetical protein
VTVGSSTLLSAFIAGELPHSTYDRFCFGGADWRKTFVLGEDDSLTPSDGPSVGRLAAD